MGFVRSHIYLGRMPARKTKTCGLQERPKKHVVLTTTTLIGASASQ